MAFAKSKSSFNSAAALRAAVSLGVGSEEMLAEEEVSFKVVISLRPDLVDLDAAVASSMPTSGAKVESSLLESSLVRFVWTASTVESDSAMERYLLPDMPVLAPSSCS